MTGVASAMLALLMIPPSTASTLRTSQIVVAFVSQVIISNTMPEVIDVLGAVFILLAALTVTFENQVFKGLRKCCFCDCCKPQVTATISDAEMQLTSYRYSIAATAEAINVAQDIRPQAPGRVRLVSISLS